MPSIHSPDSEAIYEIACDAEYSYFNPAFVREFEPHGKPVDVAATSVENLQITRIPAKAK